MLSRILATILFTLMCGLAQANGTEDSQRLFTIAGKIAHAGDIDITVGDFAKLPPFEINTVVDTIGDNRHIVKGVLGRDLLKAYGANGKFLRIIGLDRYTIDVPIDDLMNYDVVIATVIDGNRLSVRDKGPAWLIYPVSDHPELDDPTYQAREVWQITRIEVN